MALILPSRATRIAQPQGPVEVDRGNPLAAGIVLDSRGDLFFRDGAAGRTPTQSVGSLSRSATSLGFAATFSSAVTSFGDVELFTGAKATWQIIEMPNSVAAVNGIINKRSSALSQHSYSIGYNYNAAEFTVDVGSSAGTAVGVSYRFSRTTLKESGNNLIVSIDGSAGAGGKVRVHRNGTPLVLDRIGAGADVAFTTFPDTTAPLEIGRVNNGELYYAGKILLVRAWNRGLSDGEIKALSENPWQIFRPIQRRIIVDLGAGGGPVGGNASATPAPLTVTPATATATGAASTSATPAPVSATAAQATATGGASAQAAPAPLTTTAAQATATGAAQAEATPAPVQLTPATATASSASGGEVAASATPAPLSIAAPTATATGGASAQATPALITTTAPTATVGSGASASATLAALGLMPATGTATGGAAATALPAQIIITPAAGSAKGGAQAYSTPAPISITPATGIGSDGVYAPITWPSGASASQAAMVPAVFGLAIVQPVESATVPRVYLRALVPIHGDDMTPIKTFELHPDDREIYELDFDRLYLSTARDSAATLEAITAPAGLTVTPEVSVGGALTSGVVRFAAAQTGGPGSYDVSARISTAAGRRKTATVTIAVAP